MLRKEISATEAARNFSGLLDQVQHQRTGFTIRRGKEAVARIVPAQGEGLSLRELQKYVAEHAPGLTKAEAESELKALRDLRKQFRQPRTA